MTVAELIAELQKQPADAEVVSAVGWARDTAVGEGEITVSFEDGRVEIRDWLSDCDAELA